MAIGSCCKCFVVLVGFLAVVVYNRLTNFGIFQAFEEFGSEKCEKIPSFGAPEDIVFIPNTRTALMGVDDRIALLYKPNVNLLDLSDGGITAVQVPSDMKSPPKTYSVLLTNFPANVAFHPHGLDILQNSLYVISHAYSKGGERIEVFKIQEENTRVQLAYERSIILPEYMSGISNDITFINPSEFFISIWKDKPDSFEGRKETFWDKINSMIGLLLGWKKTGLYRCKETSGVAVCNIVHLGLIENGIARRNDELFVTDSGSPTIMKFRITPTGLEYLTEFKIGYLPDNIEYDPEKDRFYIGMLSKAMSYIELTESAKKGLDIDNMSIPGGCVELDPNTGASRLIANQKRLSGVSVCTRKDDFFVLGSWHDPFVMVCPMESTK